MLIRGQSSVTVSRGGGPTSVQGQPVLSAAEAVDHSG